ncbi:fructose-6-phosphate aldolase [Avibacterium volantium]|uniref:fructose-6-phosphate aldolase n=1 Tax=Avibacterium volantium TaxID=762 RepID=UPI003BF8AD94
MMEFYLDTADIAQVRQFIRSLPLSGVTTNPSLVAKVRRPLSDILNELRDMLGEKTRLFAQIIANHPDKMVEEAIKLSEQHRNLVIKIPVTLSGLEAIKQLTAQNIPTLGTAVYGAGQGFFAALAGASYIAPYVNRIDSQGGSGVLVTQELNQLITQHCPNTQVLAASFKTPRQVLDCLLTGCSAITISPDLALQFLSDPAVFYAIEQFEQDWQQAFNQTFIE